MTTTNSDLQKHRRYLQLSIKDHKESLRFPCGALETFAANECAYRHGEPIPVTRGFIEQKLSEFVEVANTFIAEIEELRATLSADPVEKLPRLTLTSDAEHRSRTNQYVQEAKELLEKQPPTPEKAFKDCPVIRVMGDKDIHEAWLISSSMAWIKPLCKWNPTIYEAARNDLPDWMKNGLATCATASESAVLLRAYDELQALGSSPR